MLDMVFHRFHHHDGIIHHDADGQHQAEQSVRLLSEKPIMAITAKVPTMATGTATSGINADRQFCKNKSTTTATRITASRRVLNTSLTDSLMNGVVS